MCPLVRDHIGTFKRKNGIVYQDLQRKWTKHSIDPGARCVAILPDRGERYLDTIYSDSWVRRHFGDVFHHWESGAAEDAAVPHERLRAAGGLG